MSEEQKQAHKPRWRKLSTPRELVAISLWVFVLVKLAVFDLDVYLLERLAPEVRWLLNFKFFMLLAGTAVIWVALGHRTFLTSVAYVLAYPLVVLFWKLPKHAFPRWPLVVVFAPALYLGIVRLRSSLLLYGLASISGLAILFASGSAVLLASMVGLALFFGVHLYRSFRKAYSPGLFSELARLTAKMRRSIEGGSFDAWTVNIPTQSDAPTADERPAKDALSRIYILHFLAHFVAEKVQAVARRRGYDLYLTASLLYTVLVTVVVYALEYWALHKLAPDAFSGVDGASFRSFLGFSLSVLTSSNVSRISPTAAAAEVLSYTEVGCSILILVILVFSILTAAREAFRDDVQDFASELRLAAQAFENRAVATLRLTLGELEAALLGQQPGLVNLARRLRGLPEFPAATQAATEEPTRGDGPNEKDDGQGTE